MPCTQFEARERVRQAGGKRGVDSDKATIQDKDKDDGDNGDDSQEEAAPLKARICETTVDMFKQVLLFSQGAAEALYDDQMFMTLDVLCDFTNDIIKEICHAIRKPGGDRPRARSLSFSRLASSFFAFWARHMWRTSRGLDDWTDTTYDKVKTLTNQKTLEDNLLDTKPPETPAMTLDLHSAAKAFTDMLILLG
jgi:hypothetical protein